MDYKKVVKQIMIERNMTYKELAQIMDEDWRVLSNKLYRGNYTLKYFIEILNALDCDLQVVTRDTKKIFD